MTVQTITSTVAEAASKAGCKCRTSLCRQWRWAISCTCRRRRLLRLFTFLWSSACDLGAQFSTLTAEIIACVAELWNAYILISNPAFLTRSPALMELGSRAPWWVWGGLFAISGGVKFACLLFGREAYLTPPRKEESNNSTATAGRQSKTLRRYWGANPFMRSSAAVRGWMLARLTGLVLGVGANYVVGHLLTLQGAGWGTGYCGITALCCLAAACHVSPLYAVEWLNEMERRGKGLKGIPFPLRPVLRHVQ